MDRDGREIRPSGPEPATRASPGASADAAWRWNVVLLTLDSFRADLLTSGLTPALERFAESTVQFARAFAQGPYTSMSVPSLFTGRYPNRLPLLGLHGLFGVQVENVPTLPMFLQAAGYETLGFHSNPFLSRVFGFHRGFDYFFDDLLLSRLHLPPNLRLLLNRIQRMGRLHPYLPAAVLNHKVNEVLRRVETPFFLWVHYMDTHGPYHSHRRWSPLAKLRAEALWFKATRRSHELSSAERQELIESYREQARRLDEQVGELLAALAARSDWERTIVIVAADHGDEFGEHGGYTHAHKLYDELIHVPLLVRLPGARPRVVGRVVELVQVVPTVLELTGVRAEPFVVLDGTSLVPWLLERAPDAGGEAFSEAETQPHYIGCLRQAEWKFLCDEKAGQHRLYQLSDDPAEIRDVLADYPLVAAELLERLNRHRAGGPDSKPVETMAREEEALIEARLRDLGYL